MSGALGTWIDGVAGNLVPVDDRGFNYGDGLFETILVRDGRARFVEAHLGRLRDGLTRLGIQFAAEQELRADIARAVALAPPLAVLKIIVTRGSAWARGYSPRAAGPARRVITLWHTEPVENAAQGVDLRVARLRVAEHSALAGLKHLNRLENVLAAGEEPGSAAFDALLLDTRDSLVSGTASNVFVVKAGEVLTPTVDRAGIAGIMRGIVLREAPRLGLAARTLSLTLDDVYAADEVFITNARIGVVPVRRVGEHSCSMHAVTLKIAQHIEVLDA